MPTTAEPKHKKEKSACKLTVEEKINLRQSGYSNSDIQEIQQAIPKTTYTVIEPSGFRRELTEEEAIASLGREEWLKAISRSTFYVETFRYSLTGEKVRVYSKVWHH